MRADGYSLDDKREKDRKNPFGDLQDIVARYHARNADTDANRNAQCFMVPRTEIEAEGYDLSLSRYREDVFEEAHYDPPGVILERLIQGEVGDIAEADLDNVHSGIVRELLALKGMVE